MVFAGQFYTHQANVVVEDASGGELADFRNEFIKKLWRRQMQPAPDFRDQAFATKLPAAGIGDLKYPIREEQQ